MYKRFLFRIFYAYTHSILCGDEQTRLNTEKSDFQNQLWFKKTS